MAVHVSLFLSLIGSVGLAGVLLSWADRVPGARLLIGFLLGVAVWIAGNELPSWLGTAAEQPALWLLATAALTAAIFIHFALTFCQIAISRLWLGTVYGAGLATTLLAIVVPIAHFAPFAGISRMAIPNTAGWAAGCVWAALGGIGLAVLLRSFLTTKPGMERRRIGAVLGASGLGLVCMSGYGIAALNLPIYPWPLLGLPFYPVVLVYGILRYQVLVANAWARRAVAWALLVGLAGVLAAAAGAMTPLLPFPNAGWASGMVAAAAVLILGGPVRKLAERIVYPGRSVSAEDLRHWRADLAKADTHSVLWERAASLLSDCVALPVAVGPKPAPGGIPQLVCVRQDQGWQCRMLGWHAAPPAPRRLAGILADIVAEQATRVDGLEDVREQERLHQHQARLAELGALAASVAHDVRNPLNTIGMAVAFAPADVRLEVATQVRRIAHLADDLLDYARPWHLDLQSIDLADSVATAMSRRAGIELGQGLGKPVMALADPRRIDQVLANLLDNAVATGGRVNVDAEAVDGMVRLHVCDDGPGIPPDLRDRLFEPFVSRRVGGTGLGLAIVARIMTAHGGSVALTERSPWTTCFTLSLPGTPS